MSLQSQLFRGDPKLEAAAVSDPAHIVPGSKGQHVRKIQSALIQLDGAAIDADGVYGPATAAAVLAFKQQRKVVNRSYQTQADDIVGKMTMAALDRELLLLQTRPALIRPHFPGPTSSSGRSRGLVLAFSIGDSGAPKLPLPANKPASRAPAPVVAQVVIEPNGTGTIQMIGGRGGKLLRFQDPRFPRAVAKLRNARVPDAGAEDVDVVADPEFFTYEGQEICGETFFQWFGPEPTNKRSGVISVLSLVRRSTYTPEPVHPVDTTFKSGLVSTEGTPLNPRPGRKINIFGRGESNGFEDYSSDIKFCFDSGPNFKRWTDDPRKPDVGLEAKSVANICIRSSPIEQVTIDEIKRIGASGCRVTFASARDFSKFVDKLRAEFVDNGLAKKVEDGLSKKFNVIVFELN
jgi:peptidoglycan hydrolase-like protein with peptidoglycan-binding domain